MSVSGKGLRVKVQRKIIILRSCYNITMSIRLDELTPEQERLVLDLYTCGYALARVRQKSGLDISLSTIGSLIRKHDKLRHWNPGEGTAPTQSSNGHPPFS